MRIPTYLEPFVKDFKENDYVEMMLCSDDGNELFEILYYGDIEEIGEEKLPYIVASDYTGSKIIAIDIITRKEILVFDGTKHGYNSMFCEEYTTEQRENRPLVKLNLTPSKILIQIGYSIEYESEKEDYDMDEEGDVILVDGSSTPWEVVKRDGYDYIALFRVDEYNNKTQFLDEELA